MTAALAPARPAADAGRAAFAPLAAREMRRFAVNPVFLAGVGLITWILATDPGGNVPEIDAISGYTAAFLGGFGMMATFWLTRSMRASEPVTGVTPVTLPERTAALCTVSILPFACGCLALLWFMRLHPVGLHMYGAFSRPAQVAILAGQIAVPALGGPLLGVALGRWVRFPGAEFVLFLIIFGWVNLVTVPSLFHPDSAPVTLLRLFSPFAFFTLHPLHGDPSHITAWRGSPWFFLGWQLTLCAAAVLVALLRGADGRLRSRIIRALMIVAAGAMIMLVLAGTGGFAHPVTV
jgi:hypothetical protein